MAGLPQVVTGAVGPGRLLRNRGATGTTIRFTPATLEEVTLDQAPAETLLKAYAPALGVPGVGHKTARVVVSELYATPRARTVKQCSAYAGLAPHERTSGTSLRKPGRTLPTGNKRLRTALNMAAVSTLRHDQESRELYARIVGKGKHKKVAIVAVMNKLMRRVAATVERGTPYVRA